MEVTVQQRAAVLVDVQNLFYMAKNLHQSKIDYNRLLAGVSHSKTLSRAIAYVINRPEGQGNFIEALYKFGYEVRSRDSIRQKVDNSRCNSEIQITIDALQIASKVDCIILVGVDNNMIPLIKHLQSLSVNVELFGFDGHTSNEIIDIVGDNFFLIEKEWMLKDKPKFDNPIPSPVIQRQSLVNVVASDYDDAQPISNASTRGILSK